MVSINLLDAAANAIVEKDKEKAEMIARKAIEDEMDLIEFINKGFAVGITRVGDLFDRGKLFLPELIMCSEIMKDVTAILNDAIPEGEKRVSVKVIIATVEGDVHDIGKGIVVSLLKAHGFEVFDIGRDVPTEKIIEKAEKVNAKVIGTSALLTSTMEGQKKLEDMLRKEGLREKYITIIGGAPVTEGWATRIGADAYAEDANDGVKKIISLLN